MKPIYEVLLVSIVITAVHSVWASYGPLDSRFFLGEAVVAIGLLAALIIIDVAGFKWQWPLKRIDNESHY